jgi:hypothetical protein
VTAGRTCPSSRPPCTRRRTGQDFTVLTTKSTVPAVTGDEIETSWPTQHAGSGKFAVSQTPSSFAAIGDLKRPELATRKFCGKVLSELKARGPDWGGRGGSSALRSRRCFRGADVHRVPDPQ